MLFLSPAPYKPGSAYDFSFYKLISRRKQKYFKLKILLVILYTNVVLTDKNIKALTILFFLIKILILMAKMAQ